MTTEPQPTSTAEAQARVDTLNQRHYELLAQRNDITQSMTDNSAELAEALDVLAEAERTASAAARAQAVDTTGALSPPDPPPTVVNIQPASTEESVGGRSG